MLTISIIKQPVIKMRYDVFQAWNEGGAGDLDGRNRAVALEPDPVELQPSRDSLAMRPPRSEFGVLGCSRLPWRILCRPQRDITESGMLVCAPSKRR